MSLTFFCIPVFAPEAQARALNDFLHQNPQAIVDRQFISDGQNSVWAVCCTVLDCSPSANTSVPKEAKPAKKRVDYRELLEPEHFARFAVLRDLRNRLAKEQGIPPYSIFFNAQLAEMAQMDPLSREAIAGIEGVGEKRIFRYADLFIDALAGN